MHRHAKGVIAILAIAIFSGAADARVYNRAEDVAGSPFAKFLVSKVHFDALARIMGVEEAALGRVCEDGYRIAPTRVKILRPITMPDDAQAPIDGEWIERFTAIGCDRTRIYNAVFVASQEGVEFKTGGPGRTTLDLRLVRDLRPVIVPKAQIEECQSKFLLNTEPGTPAAYDQSVPDGRYETWTVTGCNEAVDLVLLIEEQASGQFSVSIEAQLER